MQKGYRKSLLLVLLFGFVISATGHLRAQEYQGFYFGLHWEKNGTVNNRIGFYNSENGYFIADIGWPIYLASLAEWKDNDSVKHVNGEQIRLFSLRGGVPVMLLDNGYISIDFCGQLLLMRAQLDSTKILKQVTTFPISIGPSWAQSIGERFHMVTALNYGIAFSELRDNDKYLRHQRLGVDLYLHFWIAPNFLLYGNIGYGYFPRGLSKTYPYDKAVGASLIAVGFAF